MTIDQGRVGGFIQMNDGMPFWPLSPLEEEVRFEDIAHSLSLQCRWNGHTTEFYSVAQHSCFVARLAARYHKDAGLWGLMHDATEAYLCDLPTPLKDVYPQYREDENRLAALIRKRFNIPYNADIEAAVHKADKVALLSERNALLTKCKIYEEVYEGFEEESTRNPIGIFWDAEISKENFTSYFQHFSG